VLKFSLRATKNTALLKKIKKFNPAGQVENFVPQDLLSFYIHKRRFLLCKKQRRVGF